jgi:hypothetical protein
LVCDYRIIKVKYNYGGSVPLRTSENGSSKLARVAQ